MVVTSVIIICHIYYQLEYRLLLLLYHIVIITSKVIKYIM